MVVVLACGVVVVFPESGRIKIAAMSSTAAKAMVAATGIQRRDGWLVMSDRCFKTAISLNTFVDM